MKLLVVNQREREKIATLAVAKTQTARTNATDQFRFCTPSGWEGVEIPYEIALDTKWTDVACYVAKNKGYYSYTLQYLVEEDTRYYPSGQYMCQNEYTSEEFVFLETKYLWPLKKVIAILRSRKIRRQLRKFR
jgi:hypothetical protein